MLDRDRTVSKSVIDYMILKNLSNQSEEVHSGADRSSEGEDVTVPPNVCAGSIKKNRVEIQIHVCVLEIGRRIPTLQF